MTIYTTDVRKDYQTDGVSTDFPVPFDFFDAADIRTIEVDANGVRRDLTQPGDYTVSGGKGQTGLVRTNGPRPAGGRLVLRRRTDRRQQIDYTAFDRFPAETHESGLDRDVLRDQEIDEEVGRSLRYGDAERPGEGAFLAGSRKISNLGYPFDGTDAAQLDTIRDVVQEFINRLVPVGGEVSYDYASRSAAQLAQIGPQRTTIRTGGCNDAGDLGAALYRRAAAEPVHAGKFKDALGAWWQLAEGNPNICMFGARANSGIDCSQAFADAWTYADTIEVPVGDYTATRVDIPGGKRLINRGHIIGLVSTAGTYVNVLKQVTLPGIDGDWTRYPVGTDFWPMADTSGWNVGDLVAVDLHAYGDPAQGNELGKTFGIVIGTTGGLKLDTATRWAYDIPVLTKCSGGKVLGTLKGKMATGGPDITIPGDWRGKFAPKDTGRLENVSGTDTINGSTAYWESFRVKDVDADKMTLETPVAYTYLNYFVVKTGHTRDIKIRGGSIDFITLQFTDRAAVEDVLCNTFGANDLYDFMVSGIRAISDQPRGFGFTWSRKGVVSGCVTSGSVGITDNAAFKINGCVECSFLGIQSYDTFSSTAQGIYPFFVDIFLTPYWNFTQDCNFSDVTLGKPSSVAGSSFRSAWIVGMRGGTVKGLVAAWEVQFEKCINMQASGITSPFRLWTRESKGCSWSGLNVSHLRISATPHCTYGPGIVQGALGDGGRNVWLAGGVAGAFLNSDGASFIGIRCNSENPGDTFFYLQGADGVFIDGCSDKPGLLKSVAGGGATNVEFGTNQFKNRQDNVAPAYAPRVYGALTDNKAHQYQLLRGNYQRLGTITTVNVIASWTGGTDTGTLQVSLPFPAQTGTTMLQSLSATVEASGAGASPQIYASIPPGASYAELRVIAPDGSVNAIGFRAAGSLRLYGSYLHST